MKRIILGSVVSAMLVGGLSLPLSAVVVTPKPYTPPNNNNNAKAKEEPARPEPVVIRLQSAQRQKLMGNDIMVVTGTEVLTGKQRVFGVENEAPQNKNAPPKYEPRARILEEVNKVKPGDYFRIEPKAPSNNYNANNSVVWIDKAAPFKPAEHEEEPGTYVLFDSYKEKKDGVDVYVITLTKFAKYYDCYAPMIQDGKNMVPDPVIVKIADDVKKKEVVEATLTPAGPKNFFITSIDPYQAPRTATFTKLVDTEVQGTKTQAAEVEEEGKTNTLLFPGKMQGKKWVTDPVMLAEAKKLKPGSQVLVRTRDVDGKAFVRQLSLVPKDPHAAPSGKSKDAPAMKETPSKDAKPDAKPAK